MDATKIQIRLLEGKSNWSSLKYNTILLRSIQGGTEVVEGKLTLPEPLPENATQTQRTKYEKKLKYFNQADNNALLVLTVNIAQETLAKLIRYSTAREVWQELHSLYDGYVEDKTYDTCMQFFSYTRHAEDDISSNISKLKNLWNILQNEISKDKVVNGNTCKCNLPELLVICKILETLSTEDYSFKSSWMLMSKNGRTIDSLTNQLCAYEKALSSQSLVKEEVMFSESKEKFKGNHNMNLFCKYCKRKGHKIIQCFKWKADGKPSKPGNEKHKTSDTNVTLVAETNSVLYYMSNKDIWYVDNGAKNHITDQSDMFQEYTPFDGNHRVTIANRDSIPALGQGTLKVKACVNGRKQIFAMKNGWYVPEMNKNFFSVSSVQDKNTDSLFIQSAEKCQIKLSGETIFVGT
ncbi:uncharacterized protein [Leptinotarsa decemlineata]|uniref:uncharacterized protein n=1 Tax=Leptinotarsa decemlineata TaxID=7539 RepID=UPI003D309155